MGKFFKETINNEKRKKEIGNGNFQNISVEQQRVMESKEKSHLNFCRYLETLVMKLENILKNYKTDEKLFFTSI